MPRCKAFGCSYNMGEKLTNLFEKFSITLGYV